MVPRMVSHDILPAAIKKMLIPNKLRAAMRKLIARRFMAIMVGDGVTGKVIV